MTTEQYKEWIVIKGGQNQIPSTYNVSLISYSVMTGMLNIAPQLN